MATNAVFEAGWSLGSQRMMSQRREKSWSSPVPAPGPVVREGLEAVILDGGLLARPSVEGGVLRVDLATDGTAAPRFGRILAQADSRVRPAAVATRVGLAVLYGDPEGQVRLWHGSLERLEGEEPVAAARRLDAPPLEVHSAAP